MERWRLFLALLLCSAGLACSESRGDAMMPPPGGSEAKVLEFDVRLTHDEVDPDVLLWVDLSIRNATDSTFTFVSVNTCAVGYDILNRDLEPYTTDEGCFDAITEVSLDSGDELHRRFGWAGRVVVDNDYEDLSSGQYLISAGFQWDDLVTFGDTVAFDWQRP